MKKTAILFALVLSVALAGCGQSIPPQSGQSPAGPSGAQSALPAEEPPSPAGAEQTATLYIGTQAIGFAEYPMTYEGALTPELLIQGIADLTGWDLTLAEPVISGSEGISVCLSKQSVLFTGPPEPQKDDFHMFSAEQLAETVLDSIQKTLQSGFAPEPGGEAAPDIWYCSEGAQPLELPGLGLSWPSGQPYQWTAALPAPEQT